MSRSMENSDHVIAEFVRGKHGMVPKMTSPQKVLTIPDKEHLEAQLNHYKNPFLINLVPDDAFARRHYVEKIRPALRYYCRKFNVDVPPWLRNDKYYTEMEAEEKMHLFNTTHLRIYEFKKLPTLHVERDHGGGQNEEEGGDAPGR
jgi:hypothetical protein